MHFKNPFRLFTALVFINALTPSIALSVEDITKDIDIFFDTERSSRIYSWAEDVIIPSATMGIKADPKDIDNLLLDITRASIDERLQVLEDQRDLTDWRDYPKFKELTTEVCTYVAQPFEGDAIETNVLPQGEVLHRWIDSIIRTRHKFSGQPCLGKHGMMNRYTMGYPEHLTYNHEHHIATIMMIDAMAKLAIADDEFYDAWAEIAEDVSVSTEFIKRVLDTMEQDAYGETKPGMWRVKAVARTILQKNPALVRLAGDIFSLYAPKMDLKKVYNELMASGGTYRGWEIFGLDNFAYVINLSEEEKAKRPWLESYLRTTLIRDQKSLEYMGDCASTPARGHVAPNLTINEKQLIEIKYIYKFQLNSLLEEIKGVVSQVAIDSDPVSFYLRREPKPELLHLLSKRRVLVQEDELLCSYKRLANQCHHGESLAHSAETLAEAVSELRNSFEAGYEDARNPLRLTLCNYAAFLANKPDKIERNFERAIKLLRESLELGNESAKKALGHILFPYALIQWEKMSKDIKSNSKETRIIARDIIGSYTHEYLNVAKMCRESYYECGIQEARGQLGSFLTMLAVAISDSSSSPPSLTIKERVLGVRLLREACYALGEERAKGPLSVLLFNHADFLSQIDTEFYSLDVYKHQKKMKNLFAESARLGNMQAQNIVDKMK